MNGLANKYRPRKLADVVGQAGPVAALRKAAEGNKVPHAALFCGPPGCGKTTCARIMARLVGCRGGDLEEINCADKRGIDDVRRVIDRCSQAPFHPEGKARVFLMDEAHQLSKKQGGDAQTALLKKLEEPPPHVYFFLASSEPQHLLPAIRSRCTTYKFGPIQLPEQKALVRRVAEKEKIQLSDFVLAKIVECARGSGRDALKLLEQVGGLKDEDEQLELLKKADGAVGSLNLCRLLSNPSVKWQDVSDLLKDLEDEPEDVRRHVLNYFSYVALAGGRSLPRAVLILDVFRDNYFDCGRAGLIANCFEVVHTKQK